MMTTKQITNKESPPVGSSSSGLGSRWRIAANTSASVSSSPFGFDPWLLGITAAHPAFQYGMVRSSVKGEIDGTDQTSSRPSLRTHQRVTSTLMVAVWGNLPVGSSAHITARLAL